jgi:hypothetical protein
MIMSNDAEELVTYCGLYCGDCHGYTGRVADLARDLRKELRQTRYDLFADFMAITPFGKVFENYDTCYEVLGQMVKFRCRRGCRNGGGNPGCTIRKCVLKKELDGCWECAEFETCEKLDFLIPVHGDAHKKNLRRLKKQGKTEFATGKHDWYTKPRE